MPPKLAVGLSVGTQPPMRQVTAVALAARAIRLDSLWTVDHFLGFIPRVLWDEELTWLAKPGSSPHAYYDHQILLGYLAKRAGNVQIGVGVTEPIRRHPVQIAQTFMTLSHLTKRPPILGIGSGEAENVVPYGLSFSNPVSRLEEALQVIHKCFESDGPFDFSGRFFSMRGAVMDLKPAPGKRPEIWVAAHGPRMLGLTGRYGDGWYPTFPMNPDEYATKLAEIRSAAVEAERDPNAIEAGMQLFVALARNDDEAREILRSRPARLLALLAHDDLWRRFGISHPFGEGFKGMIDFVPEAYSRSQLEDAIRQVPDEMLLDLGTSGSPSAVVEKIRELGEAGLRHAVLVPVSALVSRSSARFTLRSLPGIVRQLQNGE